MGINNGLLSSHSRLQNCDIDRENNTNNVEMNAPELLQQFRIEGHSGVNSSLGKGHPCTNDIMHIVEAEVPLLQQFPIEGHSGVNSSLYFDISNGRPFTNDIIKPIVEAELPGAFYCGPHSLIKAVQKEINSERTRVRGRMAPKCTIYQEHFEM